MICLFERKTIVNNFFLKIILSAFVLGLVVSSSSIGEEPINTDNAAKTKSALKNRHPNITISKETTYVTGPLRTEGYLDYLAALNEYSSKGVTPENNAAVSFIKALGPKELEKETRKKYFQLLGIRELPEDGPYLVSISDFILYYKGWKDFDKPEAQELYDEIMKQFDEASSRPWSKEEFPVLAALLEKNAEPLNLLNQGTRLPRFYSPIVSKENSLNNCNFSLIIGCREINRQFVLRAMYRLHSGNIEGAWEDVLAGLRLGRLVGQGPFLIDWLVSSGVTVIMNSGTVSLAHCGNITAEQSRQFQADLGKIPPMQPIKNCLDKGERFIVLDSLLDIAINGYKIPEYPAEIANAKYFSDLRKKSEPIHKAIQNMDDNTKIDWDEAFRYVNVWHDRMVEAFSKPTIAQRKQAISELKEEISTLKKQALENIQSNNSISETSDVKIYTRQFIHLLMQSGLFSDWEMPSTYIENRYKVYRDFNLISLATAGYRHDNGRYPKKLSELCPDYIDPLPLDPFSDVDYCYKIEDNGYLLYSIGPNSKDDGGKNFNQDTAYENLDESKISVEEKSTDDIVIRMLPKKN
jgi:hypothetical protein